MASKLTKLEAERLLKQYIEEQTAAAAVAEEAFNKKADAEYEAQKAELDAEKKEAAQTAAAAYDTQAVQALVNKRRVAEQVANWGLTDSAVAKARQEGVTRLREVARRTTAATQQAALNKINRQTAALSEETARKKQQNTASLQRTLKNKIAEKRLSLSKSAV